MNIEFVPVVALALVVYTFTNFVKYVRNRDWSSAATLVLAWVVGVAAVWLFGATAWGNQVNVGEKSLDLLSFPDKLVVGLVVMSAGSTIYDLKRSFDRSDSAATPALIPGGNKGPVPPTPPPPSNAA
jgi:hypothetical protein